MNAVPAGWTFAPLTDVVDHKSGNSKIIKGKQSNEPKPGLTQGFSASGPDIWVADQEYESEGVVVSAVGARCGKTFYATGAWTPIANTHALVPKTGVRPRFLWYLTNRETWWIKGGTAQPFVRVKQTLEREQLLPPPVEQDEIVRILDTQLARLDTVLEAVQAVRDRADQLRRSLLHAAFTGQLTQPDPSRGDELPESWSPMTIAQALEFSIGGVWGSEPGSDEVDVDVIRVTELKAHGRIDPSSSARRSITSKQLASRRLHEDDLLLEKSGGGPKTPVGRVGLVPRLGGPSVCANFMMLMRTDLSVVRPKFMHLLLNHLHREGVTAPLQKATTNIRNLKTKDYLDLLICLPQLDEQDRLLGILGSQIGRLDGALSVADRVEAECGRLRRSLLQAAFTGELTKTWREANG